MTSQTKAILKIKHVNCNNNMIKDSFKNSKCNNIKALIFTSQDGNPPELLFKLKKQLLKLGGQYDLFKAVKWKVLGYIRGRSLKEQCKKYWNNIIEGARNHGASESDAQWKKIKKLIQKTANSLAQMPLKSKEMWWNT